MLRRSSHSFFPSVSKQRSLKRAFSCSMVRLTKRAVVGSFILKFPQGNGGGRPQVALFRRSGKVSTYKHKYAPISGSIEETDASPLAAAWRELREETSLDSSSLRLYRQGKPYSFMDESVGREWVIHPFAFAVVPPEEGGRDIQLDWEHEGYHWYRPDEVADVDGVPRLQMSFRRVYLEFDLGPDAAAILDEGLQALRDDHESGARQLAVKASKIFWQALRRLDTTDQQAWWANARRVAWNLWKNGRESMGGPILNMVVQALDDIEDQMSRANGPWPSVLESVLSGVETCQEQQRGNPVSQVADAFSSFLEQYSSSFSEKRPLKIITLSSSSTIYHCLTQQSLPVEMDLHILESRPLFEGAQLAHRLAASDIPTTLYTDASAAIAAQDADLCLLGADLIDQDGNVSNKTGSLPAVLAAKHVSKDVRIVVVSDKDKVTPFAPPGHEENDADEVSRSWRGMPADAGDYVDVRNVYFEWVPKELVDIYVTDDGIASGDDVKQWAENLKKRATRHFDSV